MTKCLLAVSVFSMLATSAFADNLQPTIDWSVPIAPALAFAASVQPDRTLAGDTQLGITVRVSRQETLKGLLLFDRQEEGLGKIEYTGAKVRYTKRF